MAIALKMSEADRISTAEKLFEVKSRDAGRGELRGLCPYHADKSPSFGYNFKSKNKILKFFKNSVKYSIENHFLNIFKCI